MCDLPWPKDQESVRTAIKWCCLEEWRSIEALFCCSCYRLCAAALRHGQELGKLLSGLSCPTTPLCMPILGQNAGSAEHVLISWCESTCGCWVTGQAVSCPISHVIAESWSSVVLGLPQLIVCPQRLYLMQTFSLWCNTFSDVSWVWLSARAYHLTITRTGRKVWLYVFFFFFLMNIMTW